MIAALIVSCLVAAGMPPPSWQQVEPTGAAGRRHPSSRLAPHPAAAGHPHPHPPAAAARGPAAHLPRPARAPPTPRPGAAGNRAAVPSPAAAPPTAPATAPLSRAPEPLPDSLDGRAAPTGSVEPELSSEVEQNSWRARRFAASFELGWNSLAGAGLNLTWRPLAHLALDAGCGYGLHGLRFGGRVRVPLLPRRVTPYLGVGLAYDLGVSGRSAVVDTTSYETFSHVLSGFALQAVGGISLVSREGFFVMSSAGYAFALSGQSDLSPGLPDEVGGPVSKDFSGSGFTLGLALGGAF